MITEDSKLIVIDLTYDKVYSFDNQRFVRFDEIRIFVSLMSSDEVCRIHDYEDNITVSEPMTSAAAFYTEIILNKRDCHEWYICFNNNKQMFVTNKYGESSIPVEITYFSILLGRFYALDVEGSLWCRRKTKWKRVITVQYISRFYIGLSTEYIRRLIIINEDNEYHVLAMKTVFFLH